MSPSGQDIWVYAEHQRGVLSSVTYELLGKARELAGALGGRAVAVLLGDGVHPLTATLGAADIVIAVEAPSLAEFTPQAHAAVLRALAQSRAPRLLLFGATSSGMDLASLLAGSLRIPLIVNCKTLTAEGGRVVATSQLCGGKLLCEADTGDGPAVVTVISGAFPAEQGVSDRTPQVEVVPLPVALDTVRMRVTRLLEPAPGDVDIAKAPVLVAVGRGIQRADNLPMAEELAAALGGTVCGSRPVVDQGWLPLSRQVGKSGMIVKPRLYFALGISGAPEHVEGMKDADLIIAVNSDAQAPIFSVADYGVVVDMFELLPALTQELGSRKTAAA
ncbi:MAG: electron transfer flavoprotein subunit alpha/FixB family protein [Armatimonadota bacterium]|nr:electron transfer flavoprotein subunit alpha/FixB family protein [Armatimonadota bacterium]